MNRFEHSYTSVRRNRVNKQIEIIARRLGFLNHPNFKYSAGLEGMREHVFGARAGPNVSYVNFMHEIAHAMEFGSDDFDDRAWSGSFTFEIKQDFIYDRYCDTRETAQSTYRELRTIAIQTLLIKNVGVKRDNGDIIKECVSGLVHMGDFWNVKGRSDADRLERCYRYVLKYQKTIDIDHYIADFHKWLDKISIERESENE